MELHEYLKLVTDQMRCEKARDMVEEELRNHVEDQAAVYEEFGMEPTQAVERAVEQMGDPVEAGMQLDRVHRPKIDYKILGIVAVFTILGVVLQLWELSINTTNIMFGSRASILGNAAMGFIIMTAVMYLDYSFFGKYPQVVWIGILLSLILCMLFNSYGIGFAETYKGLLYIIIMLMIPTYAGLVFRYRNNSYKGILYCIFWLYLGCLFLLGLPAGKVGASMVMCLFLTCIFILSFAIHKGWYGAEKGRFQLLLWAVVVLTAIGYLAMIFRAGGYQSARLQAFLTLDDPNGVSFYSAAMRKGFSGIQLWGSNHMLEADVWTTRGISFGCILNEFGVIATILLAVLFGVLFVKMLSGVLKQKNRLGMLIGLGCIGFLIMVILLEIMVTLTIIPPMTAYLPFLTYGKRVTLASYLLLGFYLSVYRNSNILSEKRSTPRFHFRIKVEKE